MCAAQNTIKKRGEAAIPAQKLELIDYMHEHHLRAVGHFSSSQGKAAKDILWEELQIKLNGVTGGAQKTVQQWKNVIYIIIHSRMRRK